MTFKIKLFVLITILEGNGNMAEFYINTETIIRQSARLTETGNSVRVVRARVYDVASGLAGIGLGQAVPAVLALGGRLDRHVGKMNSLSSALSMSMLKYVEAESNIMGIPLFFNPAFGVAAGTVVGNTVSSLTSVDIAIWEGALQGALFYGEDAGDVITQMLSGDTYSWREGNVDYEFSYGVPSVEISDDDWEWGDAHRREVEYHRGGDFDQAETVHSYEVGVSASVSALSGEGELSGTYGSLKGEYGVLNAEAGASVYAGFISEDGKFAPGFGAEASASVSLFEAGGEARLGNDYFGVYAKGGVEVCSAEATASINAGFCDSEGNFNPSFGAALEAEAVLAQATGSAGYRVMGTDVGVQGSIGFGAGAHAEIGLQDGKFSLDAGAYLGVGGSISIELDFSDTYDTMVSAWNDTTAFVGNAWDSATAAVGDAWDSATTVAGDAWDTVSTAASDGWNALTDAASDAWDFVTFWD